MPKRKARTPRAAARTPAVLPAGAEQADADVRRLGGALRERADDVLAGTIARSKDSQAYDARVRASFARTCSVSTAAVALWLAGGDPKAGHKAGNETWTIYGDLAARRAAPLGELIKRCLRWRDSVADVLRESAEQLNTCPEALPRALAMLQVSIDVTHVRTCQAFEAVRQRTDEELGERREDLAFMATHDALTGLPNRTLMLDRTEQILLRARRDGTPVAAFSIDIDNFKGINDTLGHASGDQLLRDITARLDDVVRGADALGRIGGDQFVVIAEELSLAAGPESIAERLLATLSEPFAGASEEQSVILTASIGVAMGERASAEEFLRDADIARNRAKGDGKSRYAVFESGMKDAARVSMELEMDLRGALRKGQYFLMYQPTFDLRTMNPTGMEALLRWRHPTRGVVQPDDFIPLLEDTGMIVEVGRWIVIEACRQAAEWRAAGHEIGMAVNVSGRQLDTDGLIADVREALSSCGMEPSALTLEITETTLMRNTEETSRRLNAIKKLGVRLAIDDFGTGYSSLRISSGSR